MVRPGLYLCVLLLVFVWCVGGALVKRKDNHSRYTSPDTINPSRLLIATVLDLQNAEVIRDVHTLIRSIRIFGASLNQATVLVAVPVAPSGATVITAGTDNIFQLLATYGVELAFVPQVTVGRAKTLLKFAAFREFSSRRFDYLLWLDADAIILRDPVPLLFDHPEVGMIQCVPELYNYMVRYPELNETRIVRNQRLAPFMLAGFKGEKAPHGTCNTGVLFFDRNSLAAFLAALPDAEAKVDALLNNKSDRFLDSLQFVAAVNSAGILVDVFPKSYQLNYMAYFEQEMIQADLSYHEIPAIAQLVDHTEVFCHLSKSKTNDVDGNDEQVHGDSTATCACTYTNKLAPRHGSMFEESLRQLLTHPDGRGDNYCRMLAGANPLPAKSGSTAHAQLLEQARAHTAETVAVPLSIVQAQHETDVDQSQSQSQSQDAGLPQNNAQNVNDDDDGLLPSCNLVRPPARGSVLHVPDAHASVVVDMELCCAGGIGAKESLGLGLGLGLGGLAVSVNVKLVHVPFSSSPSAAAAAAAEEFTPPHEAAQFVTRIAAEEIVWVRPESEHNSEGADARPDAGSGPLESTSSLCFAWRLSMTRNTNTSKEASLRTRTQRLELQFGPDLLVGAPSSTSGPTAVAGAVAGAGAGAGAEVVSPMMRMSLPSPPVVDIIIDSESPSGVVSLTSLPQQGALPLSSQLQLADFLVAGNVKGAGVAICCDTQRGLETVRRLLRGWRGGKQLTVVLSASPSPLLTIGAIADELATMCLAPGRCVIVAQPSSLSSDRTFPWAASMPLGVLGVVFIDVFVGYTDYLSSLEGFYHSLLPGGVLMGSRFEPAAETAVSSAGYSHHQFKGSGSDSNSSSARSLPRLGARDGVRLAVDALSDSLGKSPLVTYMDASGICRCCRPAFYFVKDLRS